MELQVLALHFTIHTWPVLKLVKQLRFVWQLISVIWEDDIGDLLLQEGLDRISKNTLQNYHYQNTEVFRQLHFRDVFNLQDVAEIDTKWLLTAIATYCGGAVGGFSQLLFPVETSGFIKMEQTKKHFGAFRLGMDS